MIRIFTPDGTLVVEANDPAIKVTVEGDGGLVIAGAGLEEIRLRPGSYRVRAAKDGQPLPLERETVRVSQGGREVVKVKLERQPKSARATAEKGAFVLRWDKQERAFDTLAEAVLTATDGDTIEIRGNGPFVTAPLVMAEIGLTIRAGESYHPILECSYHDPKPFPGYHFFHTQGALTLEGLEFRFAQSADLQTQPRTLIGSGSLLYVANCTFLLPGNSWWNWNEGRTSECVVRNCAFFSPYPGYSSAVLAGSPVGGFGGVIDNSLVCGYIADFHFGSALPQGSLGVSRLTHIGPAVTRFHVEAWPTATPDSSERWCRLDVSSSVLAGPIIKTYQDKLALIGGKPLIGAHLEERMRNLVTWRGEHNLYTMDPGQDKRERFRFFNDAISGDEWWNGPSDLAAWRQFWESPEIGSIMEPVRFQGGDLIGRANIALESLTPDDFRLRPDSAGYRALPDGKDLGADVDLVGPGAAYERWKKTPQYEQWLVESGQAKR